MNHSPQVLFIGCMRDGTGYAHAALDYIQALNAAGVQITCRPIKLNRVRGEVPHLVETLERTQLSHYDAVIQCLLPHQMDYCGSYPRNIASFFCETTTLGRTAWADHLNLMDETWVCCEQNREACRLSGVTPPIHVIPVPCDVSRYQKSYTPLTFREELAGNFIFYTVGEFNRRKNMKALLTAFHTEFDIAEPVSLVIKTTPREGEDVDDARQGVEQFCREIRAGLKLFDFPDHYKKEIVIAGRFSEEEMLRLHASCDCGVFPSHGEAWCMPAFDSMAMGKTPIVTDFGGFRDYLSDASGWLVPATMEPAFGTQEDTFADLHTSREDWAAVRIASLRSAMRTAYEDTEERRSRAEAGMDRAHDFSYERVGKRMREVLRG